MTHSLALSKLEIENRIFTVRGIQVMVDKDLAYLYQVNTKALNQAIKRNSNRFPEEFRFQLTKNEKIELVTNCDRLESLKHSSTTPYVFTEQGVAMISAILKSEVAVEISIQSCCATEILRSWTRSSTEETRSFTEFLDNLFVYLRIEKACSGSGWLVSISALCSPCLLCVSL